MINKLIALPALLVTLVLGQLLPGASDAADTAQKQLLVIDYSVADAEMLLRDDPAQQVLRLAPGDEPLALIAETLSGMGGASALHVLSHGAPGGVFLAGQWIDQTALEGESAVMQAISGMLTDGASVLFYGCDVAGSEAGRDFVELFAQLSGAAVAASTNASGSSELGGDWELEYRTADMLVAAAFSEQGMAEYPHLLTHGRGGSITWQTADLSGDGEMNDVIITVKTAWRANWSTMPVNVTLQVTPAINGTTNLINSRVSNEALFINGTSGADADYALVTSVFHVHNVDPDTRYTVWNNTCCRISPSSGLQNNADAVQRIQSEIYIRDGNLAPKIDLPIVFQVPQRKADNSVLQNWVFPLNSSDPNADTLRYRLSTDAEMGGGGQTNPPGFSINPNTGLITWLNSGSLTPGHFYNASIVAEDLDENGNRKSMTQVDFLLELVDAPQTEFTTDNVPETRKVFVRKGETAAITISGEAINTQSLGDLQGALTKTPGTDEYIFDPGPQGTGLDHGIYPITYEIRRNIGDTANNYLIINYVVPDPNAPWVENIEGIRTTYSSPDAFMLVGDPDAPAEVIYSANPNLNGGRLKVNVSFVDGEFEVLAVQSTVDVAVNNNEIYYQGDLIGLVHPILDGVGRPLQIDFVSDAATVGAVQAVIRNLMYRDTFVLREVGDRGLSLFLRDQNGRSNSYDFFINVEPHPEAPEDSGPPMMASNRLTVLEGERAALSNANINFVDPDGGEVTLTVDSVTQGQFEFVSNPGTAITSFTQMQVTLGAIAFAHDGSRDAPTYVLVASSAGGTADPSPGNVTFFNLNLHAPQISGTPDTVIAPGEAYSFAPEATDEDLDYGDVLSFSISNKPAWADFNSASGELSGTPGMTDLGSYAGIVISVTDQGNLSASLPAFTLQVRTVSGEGTPLDPFVVESPEDLVNLQYFPDSEFIVNEDLDLGEEEWTPIGTAEAPFTGTLRGAGGQEISLTGLNGKPLFGYVGPGATIADLRIIDSHASRAGESPAGLLADQIAGSEAEPVTISGVHVEGGSIIGADYVGGLAGTVIHASISDVSSSADVSGGSRVGGLFGEFASSSLSQAFSSGAVTGSGDRVGGLIGNVSGSTTLIELVYATGPVQGNADVGGLIGTVQSLDRLRYAYANGDVAASNGPAGSVIGLIIEGVLEQVYGIGHVEGPDGLANGLAGIAAGAVQNENSYWNVDTTGQQSSPVGTGLDTEAMRKLLDNQVEDNYLSWGFEAPDVWRIDAGINVGYPYFEYSALVTLNSDISGDGSITGLGQYPAGSWALLTPTAGENHELDGELTGSCGSAQVGPDAFLVGPLFADCTIEVSFALTGFMVSAAAEPAIGGTVSGDGFIIIGEDAVLVAEPATGYVFLGWFEDGVAQSTAAEYVFAVDRERSLVANFEYVPLEIGDGEGGDFAEEISTQPGAAHNFSVSGTGEFEITAVVTRAGEETTVSGDGLGAFLIDLGNGDYRFQAPRSGRYEVIITDINTGLEQTLSFVIWPQISFASAYQRGAPGHETVVRIVLDDAPVDLVSVDWQTSDHGLADGLASQGTLLIEGDARIGMMSFTPSAGQGTILLDMLEQSLVGATFGSHASHAVELHALLPMRADLLLEHEGAPRSIVASGSSGITARVVDLPAGGSYNYSWADSSHTLPILSASSAEVSFTAPQATGVYLLRVTATDAGNPQRSVSAEASLLVVSAEELAAMCPGGDCTDSAGNGIPDAMDQCSMVDAGGSPNRLQLAPDVPPVCLETTPGYRLRLGRVSLPAGRFGAGVEADDIRNYGRGDGSAAMNAQDNGYEHLSQHVDFELVDLDAPGQAAMVMIPLGMAIPEGAVWRKYIDRAGWFTFSEEGDNALHSAAINLEGNCPAPASAGWVTGLVAGHECVRLTIVDGGINDIDREANGVIRDPGVLALPNGGDTGLRVTSGGGSAMGWTALLLLGLSAWRRRLSIALPALLVALLMQPLAAPEAMASPEVVPGWYAGAQLGQARGDVSAGDVREALAERGITGEVSVRNRNRTSGRLFAGYRVNSYLAVEAGYTDLGKAKTQLDLNAVVDLADISDILPASSRGIEASLYGIYPVAERIELYARAGLLRAKTRYTVDNSGERVTRRDTRGLFGLGAQYQLTERVALRAGYDRYRLPGEDIDHLAIGALYRF